MRYCINSAALRFVAVADMKKEGYEKYLVFACNRFHSFCKIEDNPQHLALVPLLAQVYSAGERDSDAGYFILEDRPEVGKLLWAQAPSLKMRPAK